MQRALQCPAHHSVVLFAPPHPLQALLPVLKSLKEVNMEFTLVDSRTFITGHPHALIRCAAAAVQGAAACEPMHVLGGRLLAKSSSACCGHEQQCLSFLTLQLLARSDQCCCCPCHLDCCPHRCCRRHFCHCCLHRCMGERGEAVQQEFEGELDSIAARLCTALTTLHDFPVVRYRACKPPEAGDAPGAGARSILAQRLAQKVGVFWHLLVAV